jgi:hypothetical protein
MDQIVKQLKSMYEILDEQGWVQGHAHAADGFCIAGVAEYLKIQSTVYEPICKAIGFPADKYKDPDNAWRWIINWNDTDGRTWAEVEKMFITAMMIATPEIPVVTTINEHEYELKF